MWMYESAPFVTRWSQRDLSTHRLWLTRKIRRAITGYLGTQWGPPSSWQGKQTYQMDPGKRALTESRSTSAGRRYGHG